MMTLTPEQHEEVERSGDDLVPVEDPITREPYVILRARRHLEAMGVIV